MPMIPFVKNGYYASRNWTPFVKAEDSEESPQPTDSNKVGTAVVGTAKAG